MAKLRVDKIAAPIVKDEYTGSVYFDGSGDYLSIPASDDFAFGTGDFTIEMWVYHTDLTGQHTYFGDTFGPTAGIYTYKTSNNEISLYDSTQRSLSAQNVIKVNTWHHVAWTRENGTLRAFLDGIKVDEDTYTGNFTTTQYYIGDTAGTSSGEMIGYISNLRVCKGHAVYTENFTVPTRELEVHLGAKGVVFPAADNRTVLLACQDAYNPLTEATGRHTITGAGNLGGVPGQNLVTNGDFHSNSDWDNYVSPTTSEISTDQSYDGTNSWKIVADEALDGISQTFSSNSFTGRKYLLSGYLYSSTGYARIRWRNGADGAWLYDANVGSGTANVWQKFEITATESNGGSNMGVRLTANGSGTFYFDRISVAVVHPVTDANPGLLRKTNTTSTITETTGSVYFDGGDDGLRSNPYDDLTLGTGALTIECWFWRQNVTDTWQVLVADNLYQSAGGWSLYTRYDDIYFWKGGAQIFVVSTCYSAQTWTHIAVQRDSAGSWSCYINGIDQGVSATDSVDFTNNRICIGTNNYNSAYPTYYNYNGYISNVRICKGHTVYKSNFIPSTKELEVHPGPTDNKTVFLACYDGENVFAEKTGKIIAANGDRTSSPTPTATDRPIGSTTVTPGLTREVDPVEGPTFGGGAGFVSQNWLTLPKGTTAERMPVLGGIDSSNARGVFGGGYSTSDIEYIQISTLGNSSEFGDRAHANLARPAALSSSTRGLFAGGFTPNTYSNTIDYITISSTGNGKDFGDMMDALWARAGCSNSVRGIIAGGSDGSNTNLIEHLTISTTGNTQDFGDLTRARRELGGSSSTTRGIFMGGRSPVPSGQDNDEDIIDYITIASTGNAVDFGNLAADRTAGASCSNATRSLYSGGNSSDTIEFVTIATLGNALDFGNMSNSLNRLGSCASSIRGIIAGGSPTNNTIEYVTIATKGDAQDFGDLNAGAKRDIAGLSNGHGGLG